MNRQMNRLQTLIASKRERAEKLLSVFVPAGFPEMESTAAIVVMLEEAGADFVELGIPFSDPIADGPVIQQASQRALSNGMTLTKCLQQAARIRKNSDIPLLLMGYFNPIFAFGVAEFLQQAEACGVDGLIIPDLLPEEYARYRAVFKKSSLGVNLLVSPNTGIERIRQIDELTHTFVYCTSVTGTTGTRESVGDGLADYTERVRQNVKRPFFVGFGISSAPDAARVSQLADGIIVGSAVVKLLDGTRSNRDLTGVSEFVADLKKAITEH